MNAKTAITTALVAAAVLAPTQASADTADTTATGSIGGLMWFDRDSSGTVTLGDGTSQVIPGLTATNLATGATSQTSAFDNGRYQLTGVAPGRYRVEVDTGWSPYQRTTPSTVVVTVRAGTVATADFGLRGAKVCGTVWQDFDADGMRDAGEYGAGGVPVTVNSPVLNLEYTRSNGQYCAYDLPAVGQARVEVYRWELDRLRYDITPNGIVESDPAEPFDSKLDPVTGRSHAHPLVDSVDKVVDIGLVAKPAA